MEDQIKSDIKRRGHPAVRPFIYITLAIFVLAFGLAYVGYFRNSRPAACADLLSTVETNAIFNAHQESINGLNKVCGFGATVSERVDCPGKAEILIYYGTESQVGALRRELGDTFFGAPYRLLNT